MNLYERDFTRAETEDEEKAIKLQTEFDNKYGFKSTGDNPKNQHEDENIRRFLWHHFSMFPNNYLWHRELFGLNLETESKEFNKVIYSASTETEIQTYIKSNRKWYIPASLYKEYNFAHHGAYIFPEMRLGSEYVVDYTLVGRSSDGYHIVFIEFEKANVEFMIQSRNTETESVRKGLTQIRDWKRWIDSNRDYFLKKHEFHRLGIDIPSYRFHYCLVVSRRDKMTEDAYILKSQLANELSNLKITTYDRLVDNILKLSNGF